MTPSHGIPVTSDYILAGVQAGDTVEITTKDGVEETMEVVAVSAAGIDGPDGLIPITDIDGIVKRSWKTPGHPCGNNEPVGCSIPEVMIVLSKDIEEQAETFRPACETHDYCYRHGFATYGARREECDTQFLEDMYDNCDGPAGLNKLDVPGYSICLAAATQMHDMIRRKGGAYFRTTTSTYCEFRREP